MVSVVIAAHNEATVVGRTLRAVQAASSDPVETIVVANACTDATAEVARANDATEVVEVTDAGKSNALNLGDRAATGFPRIYLDADISLPPGGVDRLVGALSGGALVAVPGRRLVLEGRPWPVRAYFAINERLPVYRNGLFGRGVIVLSESGRARFGEFPRVVADDLFLDSLFASSERAHVAEVVVPVETPFTTRELLHRLTRVRRGNAAMRAMGTSGTLPGTVRPASRWDWLTKVVLPEPRLAPAGLAYAALSLLAAIRARRGPVASTEWGRNPATRRA